MSVPRSWLHLTLVVCVLVVGVALSGCEEEVETPPLAVCTPVLDTLTPAEGPSTGGTEVTLQGLWIATDLGDRDVKIYLGGQESSVTGVFRGAGCSPCDACIEQVLRCTECERVCRGIDSFEDGLTGELYEASSCEEWVSFTTPAASASGQAELLLVNSRGSEDGLHFLYTGAPGDDDDSSDDDDSADDDDSSDDDDSAR